MKDFISSKLLINLQFYAITLRLDVIVIDGSSSIWIVTKRTISNRDEETWQFSQFQTATSKFSELVSNLQTSIFGF